MYELVKDYLTMMAYTDTLETLEQEYGDSPDLDSPTFIPKASQEETKQSPGLKRRMTIDYAENSNTSAEKKKKQQEQANYEEIVDSVMLKKAKGQEEDDIDDDDDNSRSQLTVETEKMVPLAATDCLLSKSASIASSSQIILNATTVTTTIGATEPAAEE